MSLADAGPFSYLTVLFTMMRVPVILFALFTHIKRPKRAQITWLVVGSLLLVNALVSVSFAAIGYAIGVSELNQALEFAKPEHREALQETGMSYAFIPLKAAMGNIVPFVLGVFTVLRGVRAAE